MKALSITDLIKMKKETFDFNGAWFDAFGTPERTGIWFIWGGSGNGKTTFTMQLCKELCRFDKVLYDSLEEGASLTMQNSIIRAGMLDVKRNFQLLAGENIIDLDKRLSLRRTAKIVVIDSFQYTQMSYRDYIRLKEKHRDKLLIFISHADGRKPSGRSAVSVMYDATLKIWVEGYRAFSKGRFIGSKGSYDIWTEGAEKYWGEKDINK